jgi:hypothetical protein
VFNCFSDKISAFKTDRHIRVSGKEMQTAGCVNGPAAEERR